MEWARKVKEVCWLLDFRNSVVTILVHWCYNVVTLCVYYCSTVVTLLSHYFYTVVTLLSHYAYTVATVVTLLHLRLDTGAEEISDRAGAAAGCELLFLDL
jgi:hypothetical protein